MKVKCYSVRLSSLTEISEKCYKATGFDGISDFIPISQVFGIDYEIKKSDAYWISEWILNQKKITFSRKKEAWFDSESGNKLPSYIIEKHKPEKIEKLKNNIINRLKKISKNGKL